MACWILANGQLGEAQYSPETWAKLQQHLMPVFARFATNTNASVVQLTTNAKKKLAEAISPSRA